MGFTKQDVIRSEALRAERRRLAKVVNEMIEKKSNLAGAEKGRVTREQGVHLDAIAEIDKELEGLPAQIVNPARAHGIVMGHILAIRADYEKARDKFVSAAVNPTSAIEGAEPVVSKQEEWRIIQPASLMDNYDDLVAELERIDERTREDLLYESLCNSGSMFHNAVTLAKHKARTNGPRWGGAAYLLNMIRQCFADGIEAWRLVNEKGGNENDD